MTRVSTEMLYSRALGDLARNQSEILKLQARIGSGKRMLTPADDPAAASRALDVRDTLAQIEEFQSNTALADERLALEDAALEGVQNILVRVKELALAANTGIQSTETRNAFRIEVHERLNELVEFANTQDANHEYMFAGFRSDTRPFERLAGSVVYNGDQGVRELQVSSTRRVAAGDDGASVFLRVPGGNGRFTVAAAAGNTGTGVVGAGSVTDLGAWTRHSYSIRFTGPATFDVVDDTLAVTVLSAQPYTPGDAVQFDGITTRIDGQPAAGDRFDLTPSVDRSPFETLQRFIDLVAVDPASPADTAKFHQGMNDVIGSLDQGIDHILGVRATVGARQSALEAVGTQTDELAFELQSTLSQLEDLDATEAISSLQRRITALQAIQQTFVSVSRLSLFDFLR